MPRRARACLVTNSFQSETPICVLPPTITASKRSCQSFNIDTMSEEVAPPPVRSLTALLVIVDSAEFTLSLGRSSSDSNADFIRELSTDFERKLCRVTSREFHRVMGVAALADDSTKKIFREMFIIPFENDGAWKGAWQDALGLLRLESPSMVTSTKPSAHARRSVATASSKTKMSDVRSRWPLLLLNVDLFSRTILNHS